jgi:hypothetical protein
MLTNYITTQTTASQSRQEMDLLVRQGKHLVFANTKEATNQNGTTLWQLQSGK